MRVLIADRLPEDDLARLGEQGHELTFRPSLSADELAGAVPGHEVLVVRSTRVEAAVFDSCAELSLVIRAGAGTDTIDVEAAGAGGVAVCNVPGRNAAAVAELTVGLLLAIDRQIPDQVLDLRAGRWRKADYQGAGGIAGRSIGVVGLGQIGLAFAERLAPFGVNLYGLTDPGRDPERQQRAESLDMRFVEGLEELAQRCDVLSFHVPSTEQTRGIIGDPLVRQVQPETIVLNTSRGDLVDAPSLLEALDARPLWAGLDVYPDEPSTPDGPIDSELARHPRVYGTHHVGASTRQAQAAVTAGVIDVIDHFADGELRHCVNRDRLVRSSA